MQKTNEESKTSNKDVSSSETTNLSSQDHDMYNVDICFLIDTTNSMQPAINMTKNKIKEIITGLKSQYVDSAVRTAIVCYKDFGDEDQHQIFEFNTSVDDAYKFLDSMKSSGGGDHPEDVNGGFRYALKLDWREMTTKILFHIADAPCHGKRFHTSTDEHPDGLKDDEPWEMLWKCAYEKDLNYVFYDVEGWNKKMFDEFKKVFKSSGKEKSHLMFEYEPVYIKPRFDDMKFVNKSARIPTSTKKQPSTLNNNSSVIYSYDKKKK